MDVALSISEGLARNVLAAKVDKEVWDANRPIHQDAHLQLLTWKDKEGQQTYWHSSAHLMAEALELMYPGIKLAIGPPVDQGFYYDVDFGDTHFSSESFEALEKKMMELAKNNSPFLRKEVAKADAIAYFQQKGDPL